MNNSRNVIQNNAIRSRTVIQRMQSIRGISKYLAPIIIFAICSFLISACSDDKNDTPEKNDGKAQENPYTVPTFSDEAFKAIPDPCSTVSIENVNALTPSAEESGSLQQNSIGPNKTCEWKIEETSFPRLGVSVIQSSDFFKPKDTRALDLPTLGDKVFVAPEYVTALGGDSCGTTIYVVTGKYSFSVAYCDADGKATTDEKLIELATNVKNSIPVG